VIETKYCLSKATPPAKPTNLVENRIVYDPPESGENQERSSTPNLISYDLLSGGKNTACFKERKEDPTKRLMEVTMNRRNNLSRNLRDDRSTAGYLGSDPRK
jgi:hypothetical protein